MRRTVIPELLDSDAGSAREIQASLADLRRINRWFGGISTTTSLLRSVARRSKLTDISLLDVGSGSGDVPLAAQAALARERVRLNVTLLDANHSHLPPGTQSGAQSVVGDALALPFVDNWYDVVSCSLFVHHLEPDQVRRFAKGCLRVARQALVINDLRRSFLHLALVCAGMPLYRSRLTRHDAVASVRRAYTPEELREILSGIGTRVEISRHYLYRMGVIVWK